MIDNMATLIVRYSLAALQRDDWCGARKTFEPIIKDAHTQPMTDQPWRHSIEYGPPPMALSHPDCRCSLSLIVGDQVR